MKIILFVIDVVLFLSSILLNRAYRTLPLAELRRRARSGHDKSGAAVYKAASYQESLELLLWLVGSLSASALVIMAANFGWWLATLLILVIGFFIFAGRLTSGSHGWQWQIAAWAAWPAAAILSFVQPVFGRAGAFIKDMRPARPHTNLYEKEDLLDLLKDQNLQADNRFSDFELAIVKGALTFGDKAVGQVMTPRAKLKMVTANDAVGPLLMDELHASGASNFLVVKEISRSASVDAVGTLHLRELLEHGDSGKVRDVMQAKVYFINEEQNLRQALTAFVQTKSHLLVVVNNFEEVVGALSIEQVVQQILGHRLAGEFDRWDDASAVAALPAKDKQ